MKKIVKDAKLATTITSILMMILGVMLLIRPDAALTGVCRFIGMILLIFGIFLVLFFVVSMGGSGAVFFCVLGGILCAMGLFIILFPQAVVGFVGIWFAILLLIHAGNQFREMMNLKKYKDPKWYMLLITVAFNIIVGLLILLRPFGTAAFAMQIAGIGLLISGIFGLGTNARVVHAGYVYKKDPENSHRIGQSGSGTIIDVDPDELRSVDDKKKH